MELEALLAGERASVDQSSLGVAAACREWGRGNQKVG